MTPGAGRSTKQPQRMAASAHIAGAAQDPDSEPSLLETAVQDFRAAIVDDEANEDAKFNLELALRLLKQQPTSTGGGAAHGPGRGGGAALAKPGSGY